MKTKILTLALAAIALFTTSCDKANTDVTPASGNYVGLLTVEKDDVQTHSQENTHVELKIDETKKTLSFTLCETKFNPNMPVTLNITASDIAYTYDSEDNDFEAKAAIVIPTVAGAPMAAYTLTDVDIDFNGSHLSIDFDCLGQEVEFEGNISK